MALSDRQFGDNGANFHTAEFDRVMGPNRMSTPPKGAAGGEWDPIRALPSRTVRSLRGAGYLTPPGRGMAPDVVATEHTGPRAGHDTTDAATDWYVRTAQGAMQEQRQERRRTRDQKRAAADGYKTDFQRRTFQAITEGHDTYHAKRKALGWGG